jgi:hypothetical protein
MMEYVSSKKNDGIGFFFKGDFVMGRERVLSP